MLIERSDMEEPEEKYVWQVPKVGDWVVDKKEQVWQICTKVSGGKIEVRRKSHTDGRKVTAMRTITELKILEPSMAKLLTSVNKEEL
jgi:translation initiation factor 1 (eIF-1/SUI1)